MIGSPGMWNEAGGLPKEKWGARDGKGGRTSKLAKRTHSTTKIFGAFNDHKILAMVQFLP